MYHNDLQIDVSNNSKRNINEHPIDRIPTGFFHRNNSMKNSQLNTKTNNYKSATKVIIQRQRTLRTFSNKQDDFEPSIRKPTTLGNSPKGLSVTSISSPHLLFAELNEDSTHNHNTNNNRQTILKKDVDHLSPTLTRRQRSIIESSSSFDSSSDITNVSGNNLSITVSSSFTHRSKPPCDRPSFKLDQRLSSPRLKSVNSTKIFYESLPKQNTFISKSNHQISSPLTHSWTSKSSDQTSNSSRALASILRPKSHLSRHILHRSSHNKFPNHSKINSTLDLYISPRTISNPNHDYDIKKKSATTRIILDEYDDLKSNPDRISEDEELILTDRNSSITTTTTNSQISAPQYEYRSTSANHSTRHDLNSSPIFNSKSKLMPSLSTKRSFSRRRFYSIALTPVIEYADDDDNEYH